MRRKRVTLADLADRLGLSVQTVSKGLTGKPGMSEETRSEIVKLARTMGYLTRDQKGTMAVERIPPYPLLKRRFVLLHNERSINFNRLLLAGLHDRFTEFGHAVDPVLLPAGLAPHTFGDWVEASGLAYAEGVFIAPRMDRGTEELLLELPTTRILLNYPPPESRVDSVIWDVDEAVHQSVRQLARAGHRRIMYAGDIVKQRGFRLRWQAFQEAMRDLGLPFDPAAHATAPFHGTETAWAQDFLAKYRTIRPSAIICGVDEQVAPAYYALTEAGVHIPRDCSMVGMLNEPSDLFPAMSRPYLPIKEVGHRAADRMLWRLANPTAPFEHIRIRGPFSAGSTTRTV